MTYRQKFLCFSAIGLVPIALSYGLIPQVSLPGLYNIVEANTQSLHFIRTVMGLYLSFSAFWLFGALKSWLTFTALISLVIFMFGLAAGRSISFIIDGVPHGLLLVYFCGEMLLGLMGLRFLFTEDVSSTAHHLSCK